MHQPVQSTVLESALELASHAVRFFPVRPNNKEPASGMVNFSARATSDPTLLRQIFGDGRFNSGIACGRVADGLYLVGVDIDVKKGVNGFETLEFMHMIGQEFPETWSQETPSGGEHRLFWSPVPIRQGVNICPGIDFRGEGGYLVGPGSTIDGLPYVVKNHGEIARFPDWAIREYAKPLASVHQLLPQGSSKSAEDQVLALKRSVEYLQALPPVAHGSRNDAGFKTVARLKDFGLSKDQIPGVLLDHWKCEPMVDWAELVHVTNSAFNYGKNSPAVLAPEHVFPEVVEFPKKTFPLEPPDFEPPSIIDKFNDDHFFIAADGVTRVCWETARDGQFHLERFSLRSFREKYLATTVVSGNKNIEASTEWLRSKTRREYEEIRFDPTKKSGPKTYNLFKGFATAPCEPGAEMDPRGISAARDFLRHIEENVCNGDKRLAHWLLGFYADIFQNPGEKPQVALVYQGLKGTGKTIVSEMVNHLIGRHSILIQDRNAIGDKFNSILEDKLSVVFDEAFWSGDKQITGMVHGIITSKTRNIMFKGMESHPAKVYDRITIIGNDLKLVSASAEERRYAVFKVGAGQIQNVAFFKAMREGITLHGGDRFLMRYFLDYNYSDIDVNVAPATEGLNDQKTESLGLFETWWLECLQEGSILGTGVDGWIESLGVRALYDAFARSVSNDGGSRYKPTKFAISRLLEKICPSAKTVLKKVEGNALRCTILPPIEVAREEWDKHMRFKSVWE